MLYKERVALFLTRDPQRTPLRLLTIFGVIIFATLSIFYLSSQDPALPFSILHYGETIRPPYRDQFWEVGQKAQQLAKLIAQYDEPDQLETVKHDLRSQIEHLTKTVFPFVRPAKTKAKTPTPFTDLRRSFGKDTKGIIISIGGGPQAVRYGGHLISSLRQVLSCDLPIEVAYAGEHDLKEGDRSLLQSFDPANHTEFVDTTKLLDDRYMKLAGGDRWAIKAFAALSSRFEQVIIMDPDVVFMQRPETLFYQQPYRQHGAYLFHDRLPARHDDGDHHHRLPDNLERSEWLKNQIKQPSVVMKESGVWSRDGYFGRCDAGVVVLDKSRPEVLTGLMHVAWQSTGKVRAELAAKGRNLTVEDREAWWLGLELARAGYGFEMHHGSVVGWGNMPPLKPPKNKPKPPKKKPKPPSKKPDKPKEDGQKKEKPPGDGKGKEPEKPKQEGGTKADEGKEKKPEEPKKDEEKKPEDEKAGDKKPDKPKEDEKDKPSEEGKGDKKPDSPQEGADSSKQGGEEKKPLEEEGKGEKKPEEPKKEEEKKPSEEGKGEDKPETPPPEKDDHKEQPPRRTDNGGPRKRASKNEDQREITRVCSFTIAHSDDRDELFWFTGGQLRNEQARGVQYGMPDSWMVDGTWQASASPETEMSCMEDGYGQILTLRETELLARQLELSNKVDETFRQSSNTSVSL